MLVPYSLKAKNLYSFKDLSIPFHKYNNGLTLIMGYNADMDDDNGAGKSNIFKILYFSIWGEDSDGVPFSEIIHDGKDKEGFWSEFIFKDNTNGDTYKILRWRDIKKSDVLKSNGDSIKGTGIEFTINGALFHDPSFKEKEVKPIIQKRLGMTPNLFKNSIFIKQNQKENFLEANDTKKKEIVTDLLDMAYLEKAFKLVKDDNKSLKDVIIKQELDVNLISKRIEDKEKTKTDLKYKLKEFEQYNIKLIQEIESKSLLINNEIKKLKEYKTKSGFVDDVNLMDEIKQLDTTLAGLKSDLQQDCFIEIVNKNKVLTEQITKKKNDSVKIIAEIEQCQKTIKKNQNEINLIQNIHIDKDLFLSLEEKIKHLKSEKTLLEKEISENNNIENSIKNLKNEIERENELNLKIENELKKMQKDGLCSHCDQIIPIEKRSTHFQKLNNDLSKNKEIINDKSKLLNKLLETIKKRDTESLYIDITKKLDDSENKFKEEYKRLIEIEQNQIKLESLKHENISLEDIISNSKKNIKPLISLIKKDEEELSNLNKIQTDFDNLNKQIQEISDHIITKSNQLKIIQEKNSFFSKIDHNIEQLQNKLEQNKDSINSIKSKENPFISLMKEKNMEILSLKKELDKKNTELNRKVDDLKYLDFCKKAFSPTGIRTYILYDLIDQLNLETQKFLEYSSNGTIHIEFELNDDTNNVDNKIAQKIFIDGVLRNSLLNSGGEFGRSILAVNLALGKLSESRISGIPFNFQFLDETLKNFSEKGEEVAFSLFQKLSEDKNGLFVITHNKKMQNFANHYIYVVKKDGISKIVDKDSYTKEKNKNNVL